MIHICHNGGGVQKILIVEGLCQWNAQVKKMLMDQGYQVRTTRALMSVQRLVNEEPPDLVLIGLGVQPQFGWHLLRQLKAHNEQLPVLVYHLVSERAVQDVKQAVAAAWREAQSRNSEQHHAKRQWLRPMQATM